jgi:hypothetical protein
VLSRPATTLRRVARDRRARPVSQSPVFGGRAWPSIKLTPGWSACVLNDQRSLEDQGSREGHYGPSVGHFEQNLPLSAVFGLVGKAKTFASDLSVVLPGRHGIIPKKSTSRTGESIRHPAAGSTQEWAVAKSKAIRGFPRETGTADVTLSGISPSRSPSRECQPKPQERTHIGRHNASAM